jgi:hypothetical protein
MQGNAVAQNSAAEKMGFMKSNTAKCCYIVENDVYLCSAIQTSP